MGEDSIFCLRYPGQEGGHSFASAFSTPAKLVLELAVSCWCGLGCKLRSLFPWSKGRALLIIWPLSHNAFAVNRIKNLPFYEAVPKGTM